MTTYYYDEKVQRICKIQGMDIPIYDLTLRYCPAVVWSPGLLEEWMASVEGNNAVENAEELMSCGHRYSENVECPMDCPDGCTGVNVERDVHNAENFFLQFRDEQGFGVHTSVDIENNVLVLPLTGEIIRVIPGAPSTNYAVDSKRYDGLLRMEMAYKGSIGRFVNHSCNANCTLEEYQSAITNGPIFALRARRKIPAGKEITFNYGPVIKQEVPCGCGDPSCRGWVW